MFTHTHAHIHRFINHQCIILTNTAVNGRWCSLHDFSIVVSSSTFADCNNSVLILMHKISIGMIIQWLKDRSNNRVNIWLWEHVWLKRKQQPKNNSSLTLVKQTCFIKHLNQCSGTAQHLCFLAWGSFYDVKRVHLVKQNKRYWKLKFENPECWWRRKRNSSIPCNNT